MKRRARFTAGLLTFVALVFSLAEGAWASTCAPEMRMSASAAAPGHEMPAGHDCLTARPDERDPPDAPDCPFSPAGAAQGCLTAASVPATSTVDIVPSPEGARVVPASETEPHLLLGSALFHPPKP